MTPKEFSQLSADEQATLWHEQQAYIATLEAQRHANVDTWQPRSADFFLRKVIEMLPTLLYATDANGVILFSRGRGLRFFGLGDDEDAGESIFEKYAGTPPLVHVEKALQGITSENVRVDHGGIAYEATYQPLYDDDTLIGMMCLIDHVDDLDRAERALRVSERRMRAIFNSSQHFMSMVNTDGIIVEINDPALQLVNATREDYIGRVLWQVDSFLRTDNVDQIEALFNEALQGKTVQAEMHIYVTEDIQMTVDLMFQPIHDDNDDVSMILVEANDITERKRAERAIKQAFQRERDVSELKSRFITTTSHEFRTPLAVISSSAFLLQEHFEKLSGARRKKHFAKIQNNVDNIAAMLDDILLLGQLQSNTWEMNWELVDFAFVVRDCATHFMEKYKQHTLHTHVEPESIIIDGDPRLLRRAVMNVFRNAFIYTPEGGTIHTEVYIVDNTLIFTVTDDGIGIPDQDKPRIFDVFFRGTNIDERPGRGLGLSIVRDVLHMHKGHIGVVSKVGDGTTFRISLPYTAAS